MLFLILFSSSIFAQSKNDRNNNAKDSLAKKNIISFSDFSKKDLSVQNSNLKYTSEINKNLDQLLINTINFNTVINSRAVSLSDVGTFSKPRINAFNMVGRELMNIQIYKSK
jgi:hypothetical protein